MQDSSIDNDAVCELAREIHERGFATPAIFLFEMSKPLIGCLRELYSCSRSLQHLICGRELAPVLTQVLSSSNEVERLISLLEQLRDRPIPVELGQ